MAGKKASKKKTSVKKRSTKKAGTKKAANKRPAQAAPGPDIHVRNYHHAVDSRDLSGPADREYQIAPEGDASFDPETDIEPVEGPKAMNYAEERAFMEEYVLLQIASTSDKNEENPVPVGIGGRMCFIFRDQALWVKRKYLERLLRAKQEGYNQDLEEDDPVQYNRLTKQTGLRYPVTLMKDRNPRGMDWYKKLIAEPA